MLTYRPAGPNSFALRIRMLLLAATMLAGCAGHDTPARDTVTRELAAMSRKAGEQVPDAGRAARLQQAIDGLGAELIAFHDAYADISVELRELNADPAASRAQFEALLEQFEVKHRQLRERILQRHFELIALTSPAEWKALAPHERKAFLAAGG